MGLTRDFFELGNDAAEARASIRDASIQEPMAAIERVCKEAKRAWSGSNIGYHAKIYFSGLQPKPAGVEFNPEWGLLIGTAWSRLIPVGK